MVRTIYTFNLWNSGEGKFQGSCKNVMMKKFAVWDSKQKKDIYRKRAHVDESLMLGIILINNPNNNPNNKNVFFKEKFCTRWG